MTRRNSWLGDWPQVLVVLAGLVTLLLGLAGRGSGFGERPLAVDEYYFVQSVARILDHGIPSFVDGGYYVVGLLPQYLTALSVLAFGEDGSAYRLPALLAGLLVPVLAYRYARGHLSRGASLAVAAALLLSSWEVEFSRFARMYTPLQCATLAFLIQFDRSIVGPEWKRRYRAHLLVVVAVLCHPIGAVFAPLLFVPLLDWGNQQRFPAGRGRFGYFIATAVLTAAVAWFAVFDWRRWGVIGGFPEGYSPPAFHTIRTPAFPFWSVSDDPRWNLAFFIAVMVAVLLIGTWRLKRKPATDDSLVVLALLVVAAAFHQGVVALLLLSVVVFRYQPWKGWTRSRPHRLMLSLAAVLGLGWMAVGLVRAARDDGFWLGSIRAALFGWPDFWTPLWVPWSFDMPGMALLIAAAAGYLVIKRLKEPWSCFVAGPGIVLLYGMLSLAVLQHFYETTRYSFFLYPVSLAAVALALVRIGGRRLGVALFLAAFCFSGDFDVRHLLRSGTDEVAFRRGPFTAHDRRWYPRRDYRAVANWLESSAAPNAGEAVVIGYSPPVSYYLRRSHGIYLPRHSYVFYDRSRQRGAADLWSRQRLLSTWDELREYTAGRSVVWLVRSHPNDDLAFVPEEIWGGRLAGRTVEFATVDGRLDVLRVELRPDL